MVEGAGGFMRAGGPFPLPSPPSHRPRSLLAAIPSPGHLASGRGKTDLSDYFNLIYCTYSWGLGGGRGRRSLLYPSHFFHWHLSVSALHPHPLVIWMWFTFYQSLSSPPSLSNSLFHLPTNFVSCSFWASVQLNLYTLCTHNHGNVKTPTANTLSAG